MKLTREEKKICEEYSARDPTTGLVRCAECPLAIDRRYAVCKRNATKSEYEEWRDFK